MDTLRSTKVYVDVAVSMLIHSYRRYEDYPDEKSFALLIQSQDDLKLAMKQWQAAGGLPATWGTFYKLLSSNTDHLSEEDKVTSVDITI